jgi:transcriptional regulator with GAF, ATPase, and Fis domain
MLSFQVVNAERDADQTTAAHPRAQAVVPSSAFVVTVLEGPDVGLALNLDANRPCRVLVGQSPACDFRLTDREVSRRHAALDVTGDELRVTDLGSRNGTFANGLRVLDGFVHAGDRIRVGQTTLAVDASNSPPAPLATAERFGSVLGASAEMRRLYPLCERLASSNVPVVIEGETGTGKEVLAESLHAMGPRAKGPFVVFDCTAVPANLVESELFGHEKGAFTNAISTRRGVFEQAHEGTLFIDEIGDLDLALQPKLLRAIQRSEVRRVGGDKWHTVDVRIVAATRRDLDAEVQAGRFRDDLFYRLAVARIELPPLRARRGDTEVLASHFWQALGGRGALPYDVLRRFERYDWPGNVRELYNEVARRVALGDLATGAKGARETEPPPAPGGDYLEEVLALDWPLIRARERVVAEFQRRYVERIVAKHGGNIARAAEASGIAHRYFQVLRARHAK